MSGVRIRLYYGVVVGLLLTSAALATIPLAAQDAAAPDTLEASWMLMVEGEPEPWPEVEAPSSPDSLQPVAETLASHFHKQGHVYATVDSAHVHDTEAPPYATFYVDPGPQVTLAAVELEGAEAVDEDRLRREMTLRTDAPFQRDQLEADLWALRNTYHDEGYPLAQVTVEAVNPVEHEAAGEAAVALRIAIDEGPALWLKSVELQGAERTRPAYAARAAGLALDAPMPGYDPVAIQQALQDTGLFTRVGEPSLSISEDGGATLTIPIEEQPPGVFDLVLGVLPAGEEGTTEFVGSGRLELENVFGGGREIDLMLDQRPGQSSAVDVEGRDPFVMGWPLEAEVGFAGTQRDSTYSEQLYRIGAGYRLARGWQMRVTATREVTRPGPRGQRLQNGEQRVARSTSTFLGIGGRLERLDQRRNPRSGLHVDVLIEQGRQQRTAQRITTEGDTTRTRQSEQRLRVEGQTRVFWPMGQRQVLVGGSDARLLLADTYDSSDLFRLGGFDSLRGYDEDRFIGRFVGRGLLEYRLFVDRTSYVFAFVETGWVDRPEIEGRVGATSYHPSGGFGAELRTGLGRVNLSYALNPDDGGPANGRVHLGLAVRL